MNRLLRKMFLFLFCVILMTAPLSVSAAETCEHSYVDNVCYLCGQIGGTCGSKALWHFVEETGTLTISGTGSMTNYSTDAPAPWYAYRDSITTVVIENGITTIGKSAFQDCSILQNVTTPDTVRSFGSYCFSGCISLTDVNIPPALTTLGAYSFAYCSSLTSVVIPEGVTILNSSTFRECTNLQSVSIPDGVTSIGNYAFYNCKLLQDFPFPSQLKKIGKYAFWFCSSFESVEIPESVSKIGESAFRYCGSLKKVVIPGGIEEVGGYLFLSCEQLTDVTIGEGLPFISDYMFYACSSLENITIPESAAGIGVSAFKYCTALKEITVPSAVTSIKLTAFEDCTSLKAITLPASVTVIEEGIFLNTALTDVFYNGSEAQWNAISVDINNEILLNVMIHFNTDQYSSHDVTTLTQTVSCTVNGGVYYSCTCGAARSENVVPAYGHQYTPIVLTRPTCTSEGERLYICEHDEDHTYTEVIPVARHTVTAVPETPATCTGTGLTEGTVCSVCAQALTGRETIPALDHSYSSEVTRRATCIKAGIKTYICQYDAGHTYIEEIPMTDHTAVSVPEILATCTKTGLTEGSVCSICGIVFEAQETIPLLDHRYSDTQDASCDDCGYVRQIETTPETPTETAPEKTTPMYRLYNPNSGEHFYTGSSAERDTLTAAGWHYEGIAWNAPNTGGTPVYRLYNTNSGDHHYTMSAEERENLVAVGWIYEGVCWNSASASQLSLYRLYNPNTDCGSHHYTGSAEERDFLVQLGWHYEGIGWFGLP